MQSEDTEADVSNEGGTALGAAAAPKCGISSVTHQKAVAGPSKYGHYQFKEKEIVSSSTTQYEVLSFLGRGSYGKVMKSRRVNDGKIVAIKTSSNRPAMVRQALKEVKMLEYLKQHGDHFLAVHDFFKIENHVCVVLEILPANLRQFLRNEGLQYLSLKMIQPIVQQMMRALQKLKELGVIHTDIKPDNVMMVHPKKNAYPKIKLIDFGSACHKSETVEKPCLQTIFYRAPEIILGLPYCEAIDMWSAGCVAAELFLGWPLYPGRTEFEQMRYICQTQGVPPSSLLNRGAKTKQFFRMNQHHSRRYWRLKAPLEYEIETGTKTIDNRKYAFFSLEGMEYVHEPTNLGEVEFKAEKEDRRAFIKLLNRMLAVDQEQRVTPGEALNDPFMKLSHFVDFFKFDTAESTHKAMDPSGSHRQNTEVQPFAGEETSGYDNSDSVRVIDSNDCLH